MGSLSLLRWIFLTQELNQGLLHCRRMLYQLSYQGSLYTLNYSIKKVAGGDKNAILPQQMRGHKNLGKEYREKEELGDSLDTSSKFLSPVPAGAKAGVRKISSMFVGEDLE